MKPWPEFNALFNALPHVDADYFAMMVQDQRQLLKGVKPLGLSAAIFSMGEKLAAFRNISLLPDMETVAELKALYIVLVEEYDQVFFKAHARLSHEDLLASVVDLETLHGIEREAVLTPADVQVMIQMYNAVWHLHYNDFLADPATAIADWAVRDKYQTRAIRAVLFDVDYKHLVHLVRMMVASNQDAKAANMSQPIQQAVRQKMEQMITILSNREETSPELAEQLTHYRGAQLADILKQLYASLQATPASHPSLFGNIVQFPPQG